MPYTSVPRDLSKVKNKVAMGMTKRQLLGVICAGAVSLPLYFLLRSLGDLALYIAVIPAIPCMMMGFYTSKDGRPLEKVLGNYVQVRYKRPRVRPYQATNIYARLELAAKIQEVINNEEETGSNDPGRHDEDKTPRPLRRFAHRHKEKNYPAD